MTTPRHRTLSRIFLRASRLSGEERERYLDEACRESPELRVQLERMLRHEADASRLLEPGALALGAGLDAGPLPERIGPYRVLKLLGEGGMGVIYLAEQEQPVRRRVALKLVKPGLETRQVLARFEGERQALALMNHPGIAQVHEAGATDEGRPYFAMEYVEGDAITTFCDRARMSVRGRLELFTCVCEAVQHAHHKGVIHRDIKPSNVLVAQVDGKPAPKVIDFGIAKATAQPFAEPTLLTQAGQSFGTPAYMSPEQAGPSPSDVDTRTDVHALGALLYELLAGLPPFGATDAPPDELRRRIREEAPPRPSLRCGVPGIAERRDTDPASLARRLRGDLDWIVLKALAKERDERYASPADLAADLARHLGHEPVVARPPRLSYRARKFARKHRTGVAFAATIAALLVVGFVVNAREARRADRAAAAAHESADRARDELRHAESLTAFLIQIFEASAATGRDGSCESICDIVDDAIGDLNLVEGSTLVQARLKLVLGKVIRDHGATEEGRAGLRRALAAMADDPETLSFLEAAGWMTAILGRLDEAELSFERLVDVHERSLGPDAPETLLTRAELARIYMLEGDLARADAELSRTLQRMRAVLGHEHSYTLQVVGYLAMVYWRQGRLQESRELLEPVLADMQRVLGRRHYVTLSALFNLGRAEANHGNRERALDFLRQAVDGGFIYFGSDALGRPIHGAGGMRVDPLLAPLHGDPEFEAIVDRAL